MINEYENLIRTIILDLLDDKPLTYKVSEDRIKKWEEKKEIETKKNKGICLEHRLLYYSDFYDLKNIIFKNWELFSIVFLNKKRFEIFFEELENYRNAVMHGRSLTKGQSFILEGILLDTKNVRTIYHNKRDMKEDYFIRINNISDNLGSKWVGSINSDKITLRVGVEYELLIEANDPLDREIVYELIFFDRIPSLVQHNNRFNIKISKEFICRSERLIVKVSTPTSNYKNEDLRGIDLTVLPE